MREVPSHWLGPSCTPTYASLIFYIVQPSWRPQIVFWPRYGSFSGIISVQVPQMSCKRVDRTNERGTGSLDGSRLHPHIGLNVPILYPIYRCETPSDTCHPWFEIKTNTYFKCQEMFLWPFIWTRDVFWAPRSRSPQKNEIGIEKNEIDIAIMKWVYPVFFRY